jgi:hypothetical protein
MDSRFAQPIDLGMAQFKLRIVVLLLCQRGLPEGALIFPAVELFDITAA